MWPVREGSLEAAGREHTQFWEGGPRRGGEEKGHRARRPVFGLGQAFGWGMRSLVRWGSVAQLRCCQGMWASGAHGLAGMPPPREVTWACPSHPLGPFSSRGTD